MVQFILKQRSITLKIVYYGPALSGKTTNLQAIHHLLDPNSRGRLMILDTSDDRTLFFDLMPVFFRTKTGFTIKVKLYTVPGQVMHNSTRRIVLQGADGIVFVADSQKKLAKENNDSWTDMTNNLKLNGMNITDIPIALQFNKRDLPDVRTDEEIAAVAQRGKEPVFKSVATTGEGVLETFEGILRLSWQSLNKKYGLSERLGLEEEEFIASIIKKSGDLDIPEPTIEGI
jgi:signal recognition particle receptor subunit beta